MDWLQGAALNLPLDYKPAYEIARLYGSERPVCILFPGLKSGALKSGVPLGLISPALSAK